MYRTLLAQRRVLVLLDNAVDDEQVVPLLPGSSSCAVLVNSRGRLGALTAAHTLNLDVLERREAVELLTKIAGGARVASETEATLELTQQCGYLPLALRVAGAKLAAKPHWPVRRLVHLFRDERSRINNFSHGYLDVKASIWLSYRDLNGDLKTLLRRLGNLDVPEVPIWVAAALLEVSIIRAEEMLEQLFDAQLVEVAGQDFCGSTRYRIHDLVRIFANDLAVSEELDSDLEAARVRAYGVWLDLTETAESATVGKAHHVGPQTPRWTADSRITKRLITDPMSWFEIEEQAILAVVRRARRDRVPQAWELACVISPLLTMRRHFDVARDMLEAALTQAREEQDREGEATVLFRLGGADADRTEYDSAVRRNMESAHLFREHGEEAAAATALAYAAMAYRLQGDLVRSLNVYDEALAQLRLHGNAVSLAFCLRGIAQIHLNAGRHSEAESYLRDALDVYDTVSAPQGHAQALFWQGMLRIEQERYAEAEECIREAHLICQRLKDRPGVAQCLRGLGVCSLRRGDRERARRLLQEALALVQQPRPTFMEVAIRQSLSELQSTPLEQTGSLPLPYAS
ncbi:hypothetical protein KRMM14A1259_19050 [Krasilnikovia sp. MM14-A1259]